MRLPSIGSRVSIRYRLPEPAAKPFTDVIGYITAVQPNVLVRTKSGEVVSITPTDVVSARELSHTPVRASEIRALEHAAALAWPGVEQQWIGGWFCRAGHGITSRANSAVPLDISAQIADLAEVARWYRQRELPALLALPERLLPLRTRGIPEGFKHTRVLVREIGTAKTASASASASALTSVLLADAPNADWLRLLDRAIPTDVLTAVLDGALTFATAADAAVGRGAVTTSPDGARWLGISSVRVDPHNRRRGHARAVCEALLAWGRQQGAHGSYVQVLADNEAALRLYESMGFTLHHTGRYLPGEALL